MHLMLTFTIFRTFRVTLSVNLFFSTGYLFHNYFLDVAESGLFELVLLHEVSDLKIDVVAVIYIR